jgi:hypothetical protein
MNSFRVSRDRSRLRTARTNHEVGESPTGYAGGTPRGWYDLTYALYGTYFATWGNKDPTLYAPAPTSGSRTGRPNSNGWIVELDYLPFNKSGGPSFWPWFNPKFIVQYTLYTEFNGASRNYDGSGRRASDNNTLYVAAWFPF